METSMNEIDVAQGLWAKRRFVASEEDTGIELQ
jgi:hypothetical protein